MEYLAEPSRLPRLLAFLALLTMIVTVVLVASTNASAAVLPVSATFANGDFSEFSQTNASSGSLKIVPGGYGGAHAARATYDGGGANGFARGIYNVDWHEGDDVWYGAAYYLPPGFIASMQGQVALLRWDNFPTFPNDANHGGVVIYGGDKHAHLVRDDLGKGIQTALADSFALPEGRWFWLEVHQHFASGAGAHSEVFLDGKQIVSSTAPNMYAGRGIQRIRYGIVAIADGAQTRPLWLEFTRASVSRNKVGPLPGLAAPGAGAGAAARQPTTLERCITRAVRAASRLHRGARAALRRCAVAAARRR